MRAMPDRRSDGTPRIELRTLSRALLPVAAAWADFLDARVSVSH